MTLARISAAAVVALLVPAAALAASGQAQTEEALSTPPPVLLAAFPNKSYKFVNPLPFPVWIKIYGDASLGYPKVVKAPAPPAPFAPIPYPNTSMEVRIKPQGGNWSPKMKIKWKPGQISLKSLLGL